SVRRRFIPLHRPLRSSAAALTPGAKIERRAGSIAALLCGDLHFARQRAAPRKYNPRTSAEPPFVFLEQFDAPFVWWLFANGSRRPGRPCRETRRRGTCRQVVSKSHRPLREARDEAVRARCPRGVDLLIRTGGTMRIHRQYEGRLAALRAGLGVLTLT